MERLIKIIKPESCVGRNMPTYIKQDEELQIVFSRYSLHDGKYLGDGFWHFSVCADDMPKRFIYFNDLQMRKDSECRILDPLMFLRRWYYEGLIKMAMEEG